MDRWPTKAHLARHMNRAESPSDLSQSAQAKQRLKTGRNDPCPCGSGKKYKKCCLRKDEALAKAPEPPAPVFERAEPERPQGSVEADESDSRWSAFRALGTPTKQQMNQFPDELLAEDPEGTEWSEVIHEFAKFGHDDILDVLRRIDALVPRTAGKELSYAYWAAIEELDSQRQFSLLPEVAARYVLLDAESYDLDALFHIFYILLDRDHLADCLALMEHFNAIDPSDGSEVQFILSELRMARQLRLDERPSPELVEQALISGIDADAKSAADIISGRLATPGFTKASFEIASATEALINVGGWAWRTHRCAPERTFRGLDLMVGEVSRQSRQRSWKGSGVSTNLLDYLEPKGMERFVASATRVLFGLSSHRARILIDAMRTLLDYAAEHELVDSTNAAASVGELDRIKNLVNRL